jgi:hypothetical protein
MAVERKKLLTFIDEDETEVVPNRILLVDFSEGRCKVKAA